LRLRPRSDATQTLHQFSLSISPTPQQISDSIDLDGNVTTKVWFADSATPQLTLQTLIQVETFLTNPFTYILEPWAVRLPIDYPSSLQHQLQPYLTGHAGTGQVDAVAQQLAQELWLASDGQTTMFLSLLNQKIYQTCQYTLRETGDPFPAGLTWTQQCGSCRDFTVLFMEVCRAIGLAARFVSGYQEGDPDSSDRHLHAWAEVYLPGAGWRGYDPTQGLAVADGHIALVASPFAQYTTPVLGALKAGATAQSTLTYQLLLQKF
jgi:transglutaminase-like putative cysteine protease